MINIKVGGPQATVDLQARKTLEGNILIMDHDLIDIVLMPESSKVVAFPKSDSTEETYNTQSRFFNFLSDKGIITRESIQGGNIFSSLEGVIPESKSANGAQAAVYVISEFISDEAETLRTAEDYERNLEKYFLDPTDQDSTELGEVPQQPQKGAMVPGYYYIPLRYKV
jgi:hypothetical protein|tara:strand:- start:300 stop:806 length:507 start_codon:yes stop_codon:yes gene_type:complete